MAKKNQREAIAQKEFNLRCLRHLREGFIAAGEAEWVARADEVISHSEADIAASRLRAEK